MHLTERDGAAVNGRRRLPFGQAARGLILPSRAMKPLRPAHASARRSIAPALLGLFLLLGLAVPNEAHAQCRVGLAIDRANGKFDYHRQWSDGKLTVATAAYRAMIALGKWPLPAWTGANISGNAPTTAISVADLRKVLSDEGENPNEPNQWRIVTSELACVEAALPVITISGGPEASEGGDAQFTVTISRAPDSAMTVNLNVADVAGSDFVASGNGRQDRDAQRGRDFCDLHRAHGERQHQRGRRRCTGLRERRRRL